MAVKVIMPKQGLQMTEGKIVKWLVSEGEKVEVGQPLFEIETDKLIITIDSPASGVLLKIAKSEGEVVPITKTVAVIGEEGEDFLALLDDNASGKLQDANQQGLTQRINDHDGTVMLKQDKRIFATPRAKMIAQDKKINLEEVVGTGPNGLITTKDVGDCVDYIKGATRATPVAAKMIGGLGIDPRYIAGTGDRGEITKADVEIFVAARKSQSTSGNGSERIIPLDGMRKVIADRMMESLHSSAQANHKMSVDMSEVKIMRGKNAENGIKVSYTDIMVKIVSKALMEFPIINSSLTDEGILLKEYVNIGLAVSVDNGLVVPVIKDAQLLNLEEISQTSSELIENARKGCLKPYDCMGGTFTITNLGMFDIDEFTAIINPPESAILAVGKISKTPIVEGESIVIKPIMVLSLTYDHRIIDGVPAAQFMQRIKQLIKNPYLLL